jgi:hypothetical protein
MANGNPWDYSSILLSNQSGANYARGIEQVGRAFGSGIQAYMDRKEKKEKEDATVDWLNQNEAAVNQLFPQLAQVKDPDERKKVIRAGIKGAGLENLVQVRNFTEQQRRAKQQEQIDAEMGQARLAGQKLNNDNVSSLMRERDDEGAAVRAATDPNAQLMEQINHGVPFGKLDLSGEPDANLYLRAGGRNPQMIAALGKSRPFSPVEMMTPSGLNMVQTSPNSFIPDPRVRNKPEKADPFPNGPQYSSDKKYFRSGPDDAWKPVRANSDAKLDPVQQAEFNALPGEIADLQNQITSAAAESRKGNKKPGPDWLPLTPSYDDKVKQMQNDLDTKKRRLRELQSLSGSGQEDDTAAPAAAAAGRTIADPFNYVLGG